MPFLPRRRGQSFAGFGRMSRPFRRNAFPVARKPIRTIYVSTAGVNIISTASVVTNQMLITADSPDTSITTVPGVTVAQCENNSKIIKRGSFLRLSAWSDATGALLTVWVWKNPRGAITAPVTANQFSTNPLVEDNMQLRKNTIFYWRGVLSAQNVLRLRVPLWSRRNNFLQDLSTLNLLVANESGTDNINYTHYGRIHTIEG